MLTIDNDPTEIVTRNGHVVFTGTHAKAIEFVRSHDLVIEHQTYLCASKSRRIYVENKATTPGDYYAAKAREASEIRARLHLACRDGASANEIADLERRLEAALNTGD
jgi:hypothetical protein